MRHSPAHAVTNERVVRRLIAENPWMTIISQGDGGLVASHYPALLDDGPELAVLTHVGRPDEKLHGFGAGREVLLIFAGPHGYISPSWYTAEATRAPTWNFSTVHLHGVPEVLDLEANKRTLARLVENFEREVESPLLLDQETADRLAPGTVGLRIPVARWTCKVKMSADKDEGSQQRVLAELRGSGPYAHPALADDMERARREARG